MDSDEQPSTSAIGDEVRGWVDAAREVTVARREVARASGKQSVALRARIVKASRNNRCLWHVIPLRPDDQELIQAMARGACLPPIHPDVQRELDRLTTEVAAASEDLKKVKGFGHHQTQLSTPFPPFTSSNFGLSKLLRNRQVMSELRKAVLAAQRGDQKSASTRTRNTVCPSCFTAHAGECA